MPTKIPDKIVQALVKEVEQSGITYSDYVVEDIQDYMGDITDEVIEQYLEKHGHR